MALLGIPVGLGDLLKRVAPVSCAAGVADPAAVWQVGNWTGEAGGRRRNRPYLSFSLDLEADRAGLLQAQLQEALLARPRLAAAGKPPPGADVPLTEAERTTALRALYLERVVAPREKEAAQLQSQRQARAARAAVRRNAPPPELEAMIKQTMSVSPEDLSDLASSRVEAVQGELTETYGIDPERVFISKKPETPRSRLVAMHLE